jgi:nicotinamide-nucleotide amidase
MDRADHEEEIAGGSLEAIVGALLLERGTRLAVAESCTGGRIASRLTRVPGSSGYFESACVTYSNRSKERLLSVPSSLLNDKGAVSPEVALAMAEGIRRKEEVPLGLAVTGIAGPGGGSLQKPVGLVYIALADPNGSNVWRFQFEGEREAIQSQAAETALETLRRHLIAGY